jgi:transcriptional regulator with XRE-family HTH domain
MTARLGRLGMKLRRARIARKLSQEALAKKARVTREYVNKLEAGRYDPTVGTLIRLAKALGVPPTELLG